MDRVVFSRGSKWSAGCTVPLAEQRSIGGAA